MRCFPVILIIMQKSCFAICKDMICMARCELNVSYSSTCSRENRGGGTMLACRPTVSADLSRDEDSKRETDIITRLSVLVFYSTLGESGHGE